MGRFDGITHDIDVWMVPLMCSFTPCDLSVGLGESCTRVKESVKPKRGTEWKRRKDKKARTELDLSFSKFTRYGMFRNLTTILGCKSN